MRCILLLTVIVISSCKNQKETIVNRQKAITKEMEQVKASYYKISDSLRRAKEADANFVRQQEIAEEIVSADGKKSAALLKLQKEYDSLEAALKRY